MAVLLTTDTQFSEHDLSIHVLHLSGAGLSAGSAINDAIDGL